MNAFRNGSGPVVWTGIVAVTCLLLLVLQKILWLVVPFLLALILYYFLYPPVQQLLYVVVVFALQVLLSRWWLAKFRFGLLEWLWRWVTYGRRPAMRVAAAA